MKKAPFAKDFPIIKKTFIPNNIVYLDNAATTLKPKSVIDTILKFYNEHTSNISRGNHFLSENNGYKIEKVREKTASFIKASPDEIIFTYNATDSINIIANGLKRDKKNEILVSKLEHHSNFLPWQARYNVKSININKNGLIDINHLNELISDKTLLIAITYASNVTGNIQPIKEIINIAKQKGVLTLIDATQAASHFPIDTRDLDCDFLIFSAHKMFGPSGVGILFIKKEMQNLISPFRFGGGMVNSVSSQNSLYKTGPQLFEGGTPNIEGILGLGSAIDYISEKGFDNISAYLTTLKDYFQNQLEKLDFLKWTFPISNNHIPIFNFIPINPLTDHAAITQILSDDHKILVRSGYQCSQPIYHENNLKSGIRASLHLYNTKKDIDKLINALNELKIFCV